MTDKSSNDRVILGNLGKVYGIKGWLKVNSHTDPAHQILDYQPWQIKINHEWQTIEITDGKAHGKGVVVQLPDLNDREIAKTFTGCDIAVFKDQLPDLSDDEFYWRDLIGMQVDTICGKNLGIIEEILETGANDVLVVTGDKRHLIPYLPEQVVKEIDPAKKQIKVDWDPEF